MLYRAMRWKKEVTEPLPEKCIICLAPHTSNWDFIIGQLYMHAEGFRSNFLMKKEWFFWPVGPIAKRMGGIPVFRSKKMHMTDQLVAQAKRRDTFLLAITPEGTRSLNGEWKHGFYYIALGAGIPILLFGLDFGRKTIFCTRTFIPTGDAEKDMREIKLYFKDFKGKHPEKFSVGEV